MHTDLYPANIFIVDEYRYRIRRGDFGCSQYMNDKYKTKYTAFNSQAK